MLLPTGCDKALDELTIIQWRGLDCGQCLEHGGSHVSIGAAQYEIGEPSEYFAPEGGLGSEVGIAERPGPYQVRTSDDEKGAVIADPRQRLDTPVRRMVAEGLAGERLGVFD